MSIILANNGYHWQEKRHYWTLRGCCQAGGNKIALSRVLNTKDAAAYLGMGIRTIYRLATSGQIPAAKVGGRWLFHADALDTWLISLAEANLVKNNPNKRNRP